MTSTVSFDNGGLFVTGLIRHTEDGIEAQTPSHHGNRSGGISGTSLDERRIGINAALCDSFLRNIGNDTVFNTSGRVHELKLGVDLDPRPGIEGFQVNHRRISDQAHRFDSLHRQGTFY